MTQGEKFSDLALEQQYDNMIKELGMKQTAVEWYFTELWNAPKDKFIWHSILEKAKQMEKQQIIQAHGKQLKKTQTAGNYEYYLTGEQYYKETYEK